MEQAYTRRHGRLESDEVVPALRTGMAGAVALVLCAAVALCAIPVLSSLFLFQKNYNEGWNAYHALRAASGEVLYSGDPRRLVNYPFLSFYLVAWLKPLFGDLLMTGRALNLVAFAAIAGGSAVIVRQLGGRPLDACFGAACVLGYQAVQAPGWIGSDDPQMLAEAFMIGGLVCYLHDRTSIRRLAITAILLGIGGFTKHSLMGIPAAISIDLLLKSRRAFWIWCGLGGAVVLALTGLTYAVAGGDPFHELLAPRVLAAELHHHAANFARHFKLPLLLSIAFLARTGSHKYAVLLRSWGCASLASAVAFSTAEGTSVNIFLGVVIFFGIIAALALQRWSRWLDPATNTGRAATILLPLVLAQPIVTRLPGTVAQLLDFPRILRGLSEQEGGFLAATQYLRAHEGPALCENLLLCFEAGKPLLVDPYNTRQMIMMGRLDEGSLLNDLRDHRFAVIAMPTWIYRDDAETGEIAPFLFTPARFTENTLRAIERYYQRSGDVGGVAFYRPRGG